MASTANRQQTILIVEDDENISQAIVYNLRRRGFRTLTSGNGLEGLRLLRREHPDLMILDLMLPQMDGWKLCEQAREEGIDIPIIMLSARTSEYDKVQGLAIGADDYLTKPFGMKELLARVDAHLRRSAQAVEARIRSTAGKEPLSAGPLTIDPAVREARIGDRAVSLTSREFAVLYLLAARSPDVISREEIYRAVWGYEMLHGDRSVDVFVRRIRKKLEAASPGVSFLQTQYGFGYRFVICARPEE